MLVRRKLNDDLEPWEAVLWVAMTGRPAGVEGVGVAVLMGEEGGAGGHEDVGDGAGGAGGEVDFAHCCCGMGKKGFGVMVVEVVKVGVGRLDG